MQQTLPMADRSRRDVDLGVQVVAVTAKGNQVDCRASASVLNPHHVMGLQGEDVAACRVRTLVAGLPQNLIAHRWGRIAALRCCRTPSHPRLRWPNDKLSRRAGCNTYTPGISLRRPGRLQRRVRPNS